MRFAILLSIVDLTIGMRGICIVEAYHREADFTVICFSCLHQLNCTDCILMQSTHVVHIDYCSVHYY